MSALRWNAISAVLIAGSAMSYAQLRIATWNITNYVDGREVEFQTVLYGVYEGRQFAPDVLAVQEIQTPPGYGNFFDLLQSAPGGPGDWAAAPFINGRDTDSALYYRTSKVEFLAVTVVSEGDAAPQHPRDVLRYDFRPVGYTAPSATIACYVSHYKSGVLNEEKNRRLVESMAIRADAAALPPEWNFMLAADLNMKDAIESAFFWLTGSFDDGDGQFFDPVNSRGRWGDNYNYRFLHTHDTTGVGGGMDDRFDQILLNASLVDGRGLDYIGNPAAAFSRDTWDDPQHSYRTWGNDGESFEAPIRIDENTMVGPIIAQALFDTGTFQGHLPVYLDLRVPPKIDVSPVTIDFGSVNQGDGAERLITIGNTADVGLWTSEGVADLRYTFTASPGFHAPDGLQVASASAPANVHPITMETATPGIKIGTLTIESDASAQPTVVVQLLGEVLAAPTCPGDLTGDAVTDFADFSALVGCWSTGCGDLTGDGLTDFADFSVIVSDWNCGN